MNSVRELRLAAGLTQQELAVRSGVAQPNIAAYESGSRRPSARMVDRLQAAVGACPHDVLARERGEVLRIAARYRIADVRVFGSVRRGTDSPASDVDLLVSLPSGMGLLKLAQFALDLEDLLGTHVDVVSDKALPDGHPILLEAVPV
jgi:predicted nucleotidyltransferase